jgi:uncharacterized protein
VLASPSVQMTKRVQAVHLVVFLTMLAALSRIVTGSWAIPTGDASIWIHSGLLVLILGVYWAESYFTRPSDVFINSLVVFIATSTLTSPPYEAWWAALQSFSLATLIVSFAVIWAGSPALPGYDTSFFKRLTYLLVIRIGSSAALFSAVFLLALFSYFDPKAAIPKWMLGFWVLLLVAKHLDLGGLLNGVLATLRSGPIQPVGRLSRIAYPDIARFEIRPGANCTRGALVAFTSKGITDRSSPLGVVVAHRVGPNRLEAEALLFDEKYADGTVDSRHVVVMPDPTEAAIRDRLSRNPIGRRFGSIVGFARRESEISRLRFELSRGADLEAGFLVSSPSLTGSEVLFQIVNGGLCEESNFELGERAFTVGDAQQLGRWDPERQGFSSYAWVVPENSPVIKHSAEDEVQRIQKQFLFEVGRVPSSSYPVNINLSGLVLFHSAILGVTGSGKSFLAYSLIEQCAEAGIKVLCLDLTGDYQRYLNDGVRIPTPATIGPFLDDPNHRIGIIEFTGATHPIAATKAIAQTALDWCRSNRTDAEIVNPRPKVLMVLEEAHSLVPEWNSNPTPNLRDTVNATAQITLQARKYGLGMMVVTQRTANVTKSILNQCNTIFAFQAYDETGFEFMKNYMGLHYVHALPNLKKREGVVVGKASASDRPVIVRFDDQDRQAAVGVMAAYAP